MGAKSKIEWTDATWTPIRSRVKPDAREIAAAKGYASLLPTLQPGRVGPHCEKVSPGCKHCYSETNNARCLPHNGTGLPFDRRARDLVDIFLDGKILEQPLHWRAPRRIFVCSQTDLFGEFVPEDLIDRVFAVMALGQRHEFIVLTKRSDRILKYFSRRRCAEVYGPRYSWKVVLSFGPSNIRFTTVSLKTHSDGSSFPLPNVWLGFSAEDQPRFDERWGHARKLAAQGWRVWCSAEPLLGAIDMSAALRQGLRRVVVGGESGGSARPCGIDSVRSIIGQCATARIPCFVKQLGRRPTIPRGYVCAYDGE